MLQQRGLRIFLLALAIFLALAYFGPRFGLIGCDDLPELSIGPCASGRSPDH
jgi:hypothetical protein